MTLSQDKTVDSFGEKGNYIHTRYEVSMLEGKCPKCGTYRYGWALFSPRHQSCPKCGVGLGITNGYSLFRGFSPFGGEICFINPPSNVPPSHGKEKETHVKKE